MAEADVMKLKFNWNIMKIQYLQLLQIKRVKEKKNSLMLI